MIETRRLIVISGALLLVSAYALAQEPPEPPPAPRPMAGQRPPRTPRPEAPRARTLIAPADLDDFMPPEPPFPPETPMPALAPMAPMGPMHLLAPVTPFPPMTPRAAFAPMPPLPPETPMPAFAPLAPLPSMAPMAALAPMPPLPPDIAELSLFAFQDAPRARVEAQVARAEAQAARAGLRSPDHDDRYYRTGKSYLDRREYDKAVDAFNRVIENKASRADGALYWRAYAQNKLGHRDEAIASLAELTKNYSGSRWLDDAKALEVEVRQQSGQPVSPESATDEDLKLLALQSLGNSDPERSVPMLEKLLKSGNSPRVKERALYVLAQTHSQKSRDVLAQVARGGYNPDLQLKAVEYLGVFGGKDNQQTLADVYKSSNDVQIKRAILHSFMVASNRDSLLAAAKSESNPELKVEAIRLLGNAGGSADLGQLYSSESSPEVRRAIMQGLFISGNADKLIELAKNEKDVNLRREAIHQLGVMGRSKTGAALAGMYAQETDPAIRRTIIDGLYVQGNAPALVEIARKESDPNLKKEIVQKLAHMQSKESTDYLMELLNK